MALCPLFTGSNPPGFTISEVARPSCRIARSPPIDRWTPYSKGMPALAGTQRLIIVCGLPGAGKTTFARDVADRVGAIRLSADEWLDFLQIGRSEKTRERVEALQWKLAQDLLGRGLAVIIEWGTWARSERDVLRTGARALGAAVELHFLDGAIDVLLERLHRRNRESPPITRDELLRWAQLFEVPTPEEIALFDSPC